MQRELSVVNILLKENPNLVQLVRRAYSDFLKNHQYYDKSSRPANLDILTDETIKNIIDQKVPFNDYQMIRHHYEDTTELITVVTIVAFKIALIDSMKFPEDYWNKFYEKINNVLIKNKITFTKRHHDEFIKNFEKFLFENQTVDKEKPNPRKETVEEFKKRQDEKIINTDEKMMKQHFSVTHLLFVSYSTKIHPLILFGMERIYRVLKLVCEKKLNLEDGVTIENRIMRILIQAINSPLLKEELLQEFDKIAEENFKKMRMVASTVVVPKNEKMTKEETDNLFKKYLRTRDQTKRR